MAEDQIKAELIDYMGTDLTVCNAARVSFDKESQWVVDFDRESIGLSDRDEKLIYYLAKHQHLSPFGHCFASFRITAPIFVARQLVKHEYLRMNEVSRRYVQSDPVLYEPKEWRGQSKDKKQGSSGVVDLNVFTQQQLQISARESIASYNMLLKAGVAAEQARMVLPQSLMTSWYWSGSMDSFSNMCKLRCAPDSQYETRLVANKIDEIMSQLYPVSWEALRAYES
jgi:thymidylate synthase (FAD)